MLMTPPVGIHQHQFGFSLTQRIQTVRWAILLVMTDSTRTQEIVRARWHYLSGQSVVIVVCNYNFETAFYEVSFALGMHLQVSLPTSKPGRPLVNW